MPSRDGGCTSLEELRPGVHAFLHSDSGWGHSNAGVVYANGEALLIDTQYTLPMTRQLITAIDQAGLPTVVKTVVNTHANGDHCWGNMLFPDTDIVASASTAASMPHDFPPALMRRLLSPDFADSAAGRYTRLHFGTFDFDGVVVTPPTTTFTGTTTLTVGGRKVVLHEVGPAHSDGDVIVHIPDAGVVFAGDILFADHPVMWTGPLANWISACDQILQTGALRIVPGHGPVVGPDGVRDFQRYLMLVRDELTPRLQQGMPYWEAAMDIPLGPYHHLPLRERLVATAAATYRHLGNPAVAPAEVLERMAQAHFDTV